MDRRLRVLVDASIIKPHLGGIRTYSRGLIGALAQRDEVELTILTSQPEAFSGFGCATVRIPAATQKFPRRALWRERHMANLVERFRADAVLVLFPEMPVRTVGVPTFVMVYDLTPMLEANDDWPRAMRYRIGMQHVINNAEGLICISQSTLLAMRSRFKVQARKCHVVSGGLTAALRAPRDEQREDPYVLYVGELRAHKNVETLVDAIARMKRTDVSLRLAGPTLGDDVPELLERARQLGAADRVSHLGFVSSEELARLYAGASGFVFPSVQEGFGLPVLEAMSLGVPVVASDIGVLREVASDAAWYVDKPLDPMAWSHAIERLVDDESARSALSAAGRERAKLFSWETTAEECVQILGTVVPQAD